MTERLDRIEATLDRVTNITESNARAIQANADATTTNTNAAATIDRLIETKLASLTDAVNQALAAQDERQQETDKQIQTLIEENREFRKQTERWIAALQENVQTLIAEINRVWQRIT